MFGSILLGLPPADFEEAHLESVADVEAAGVSKLTERVFEADFPSFPARRDPEDDAMSLLVVIHTHRQRSLWL